MKDYRQYSKTYTPDEWEEDKEWLARRLDFIWTFGELYTHLYQVRHFGEEKELLYSYYGTDDEINRMAHDFHYDQYKNQYTFDIKDANKLFQEFIKLINFKTSNMDSFLRKRIYIKYNYLEEFIRDYLDEEFNEYLREYEYDLQKYN